MNPWAFFAYIYSTFDQTFLAAVQQITNSLTAALRTPLLLGVTIWIAGTMAIELYSPGADPLFLLFRKVIRAGLIVAAITAATYTELFGTFLLTTLPNEITAAISGATTNGPLAPAAFDNLLNGAIAGALEVWKSLSGWSAKSMGMSIVIGAYLLASVLAIGAAFIIFMAMHVLLGLCVAVGPLFLCLLLWEPLARFFNGWLGACVGLITGQILLITLLSLLIKVGSDIVNQISALNGGGGINASDEFGQLHLLIEGLIVYGSIGFFAGLVPFLAQAIAGGVAVNITPITRLAYSAVAVGASGAGKVADAGVSGPGYSASAGMRSLTPAGRAPG